MSFGCMMEGCLLLQKYALKSWLFVRGAAARFYLFPLRVFLLLVYVASFFRSLSLCFRFSLSLFFVFVILLFVVCVLLFPFCFPFFSFPLFVGFFLAYYCSYYLSNNNNNIYISLFRLCRAHAYTRVRTTKARQNKAPKKRAAKKPPYNVTLGIKSNIESSPIFFPNVHRSCKVAFPFLSRVYFRGWNSNGDLR